MTFFEYIFPFQSHTPPIHPSLVLHLPILDTISSFYPHITSEPYLPHSTSPLPLLHPRRTINRPSHLRDYLCPTLPSSTALYTHFDTSFDMAHPLYHFVSYSKFSLAHYAFLSMLSQSIDPSSYSQAVHIGVMLCRLKSRPLRLITHGLLLLFPLERNLLVANGCSKTNFMQMVRLNTIKLN